MTLRLDDEVDRMLAVVAEQQHRSKQQIVGSAVEEYLTRLLHAQRTRVNVRRVISENAELLEDLAKT